MVFTIVTPVRCEHIGNNTSVPIKRCANLDGFPTIHWDRTVLEHCIHKEVFTSQKCSHLEVGFTVAVSC